MIDKLAFLTSPTLSKFAKRPKKTSKISKTCPSGGARRLKAKMYSSAKRNVSNSWAKVDLMKSGTDSTTNKMSKKNVAMEAFANFAKRLQEFPAAHLSTLH